MTFKEVEQRAQRAANDRQHEVFVWTECGEPYPGKNRHYFRESPPQGFPYKTIHPQAKRGQT